MQDFVAAAGRKIHVVVQHIDAGYSRHSLRVAKVAADQTFTSRDEHELLLGAYQASGCAVSTW